MAPRSTLLMGAPKCFAVQRRGGFAHRRGDGCADHDTLSPGAQFRFYLVAVYVPKDRVQRRRTRRIVGKAQRLDDLGAVIAPPFGDGTIAAIATQHRTTGQRENGGQGMAFAPTATEVWSPG